jgi:hypothetical protein
MSEPTGDQSSSSSGGGSGGGHRSKAPKVDLLTVGHYRRKDPILGGEHDEYGVVVSVGDGVLTVRPLREHEQQVDAGDFTPLAPDEVSG